MPSGSRRMNSSSDPGRCVGLMSPTVPLQLVYDMPVLRSFLKTILQPKIAWQRRRGILSSCINMAIRRISPARANQRPDGPAPHAFFDIRERGEYNLGHIPGSTSLPRRDIEFRLARLLPAPTVPVIVVGGGGAREERAAASLSRAGCDDTAILEGGFAAWSQAGYATASGVNVPSKAFGEKIPRERRVPEPTPQELAESIRHGEKPLILDVRTPEEYARFCIPGGVNVPGGDLVLWAEELKNLRTPVVVNCAGRTRSIIGTEALRRLGVKDVRALRNGTMGWVLADYDLERPQRSSRAPAPLSRAAAETLASRIAEEEKIAFISVAQLEDVLSAEKTTTVYAIDVRSFDEYLSGHIPGFFHVPGGQAVQCADDHVADRDAQIIFACDRTARAVMAAYWYGKMGFRNVFVLEGGTDAWAASGRSIEVGTSAPGAIFSLIFWYPCSTAARARRTSASGLAWIPSEMPVTIRSRAPPSSPESGRPHERANSSQHPISTAAFAMRWPRKSRSRMACTISGPSSCCFRMRGATQARIASHAVSIVSSE